MQVVNSTIGTVVLGDTEKVHALAEDLRGKLGIAEGFVHEMAGRIAARAELDLDGKMRAVRAAIGIYASEIAGGRTQTNLGDIVDQALARSKALADEGKSKLARAALRRAAESLKQDEEDRRSLYAESVRTLYGRERDIAFSVFDGEAAAEAIIAMADALHQNSPADVRDAIAAEARAAYEYGDEKGSNVHLIAAIALRRTLVESARDQDEKGSALNDLGNALKTLGERESGTGKLEEAVAAYREALKEQTRERVPLQWATTQTNLGNALFRLWRARERDGQARGGGRGLSRGAGGRVHARARSAPMGNDAE